MTRPAAILLGLAYVLVSLGGAMMLGSATGHDWRAAAVYFPVIGIVGLIIGYVITPALRRRDGRA